MGNKETKLREIFEDIDTSEDNLLTVEELKNYLNVNDPKVEEVFNNVTVGGYTLFLDLYLYRRQAIATMSWI